jgi:hypothetical protein
MQSAGLHRLRPKMMYTVPTLLLELVLDNSMSRQVAEAKPADGWSCAADRVTQDRVLFCFIEVAVDQD